LYSVFHFHLNDLIAVCRVVFVGSAPVTSQSSHNGFQWGSKKMETTLRRFQPPQELDPSWPLIIQCSSIGKDSSYTFVSICWESLCTSSSCCWSWLFILCCFTGSLGQSDDWLRTEFGRELLGRNTWAPSTPIRVASYYII